MRIVSITLLSLALVCTPAMAKNNKSDNNGKRASAAKAPLTLDKYEWVQETAAAAWAPRAGLQAVQLGDQLFVMGGRTPLNPEVVPVPGASIIWGDVWASDDMGANWSNLVPQAPSGIWAPRAYFQAVTLKNEMFVLGGQDFNVLENPAFPCLPPADPCPPFIVFSNFFSDVWSSPDGINWDMRTADAGWEGRAGLSAVVHRNEIYVMGGSVNDDSAVVGPGGPPRIYFNDVWKSSDGIAWEQVTPEAAWEPRAGAIAVAKGGYIYLLGGEDGFLCSPASERCPPYFNDVWRSRDGAHWELVTAAAPWPSRPGHQAGVLKGQIVLFGGFGLPTNPVDVWVSRHGKHWEQLSGGPWNAQSPDEIKYDFDAIVVKGPGRRSPPSIMTFGGDRETFDFTDPENYLRVDNDVWSFQPPTGD